MLQENDFKSSKKKTIEKEVIDFKDSIQSFPVFTNKTVQNNQINNENTSLPQNFMG